MQVSRDQLVEDSVFILQCLRQNARGGRPNGLDEVRSTLEGSVVLDLAAYVAFLKRFGYVEIDAQSLKVTAQGERAATGDTDVSRHVQHHFRQVLEQGAESAAFEELIRDAQPPTPLGEVVAIASPALAPVEGELGQGPLSRVRAARFGELGMVVALKEYKPLWESLPWLSRAELSRRVRREAQAQAHLGHPCVLPILEVRGEDAQVITPLAASTLRDKLSRGERMPAWQALRLGAQVAHALAHAHAQGLVHGALKPENVLLDGKGNVLLSDFGAARLVSLPPTAQPGPRVVVELGDAHYRAPEVSACEPAGPQGDAFALGALLHEMLAGTPSGVLPRDLAADLPALLEGLRSADPQKRPPLAIAAALLTRHLAPHPLFAL